jgi:signal peptidase I
MRTRHTRKLAATGLGLVIVACLWFYLAPSALGGSTDYVVTDGISMEPRFHAGDLVLVRNQSSYHVGEIVAYRSRVFHTIVLHRIIARDGSRYVFKGDNNNFVDFEHPTRSQLIGAMWLHIPGAGARLESVSSPALIGLLVAVATLLFAGAAFTRRRRLRRRQRRGAGTSTHAPAQPAFASGATVGILAIGLVALLPFVGLALVAFTRPSSSLAPASAPYRQSGALTYSADATPGPVYPGDRAATGEPLFTHVVNSVDLRFKYLFHAAASHSIAGTASLSANVASNSGWHTTMALGRPTSFHGDRAVLTAQLDLDSLETLMRRVDEDTAVSGSYTLSVVPHVHAGGHVDALPVNARFSPNMKFTLNKFELMPAASSGGTLPAKQATSVLNPSTPGLAMGRRDQPLYVSLGPVRMTVATARAIALAGIAIVTCALLIALALLRPRRRDELAAIEKRYGRMIVPVARVWQQPGVPVIDVADINHLARIAEHYDRSILHEANDGLHAFWVTDESGQFRYALHSSAAGDTLAADLGGAPGYVVNGSPKAVVVDAPAVYADELAAYVGYQPGAYLVDEPAAYSVDEPAAPVDEQAAPMDEQAALFEDQPVAELVAESPHAPAPGFAEIYADELEFGGVMSASQAQPAVPAVPAVPDVVPADAYAGNGSGSHEAADTIVHETADWRAACEAADVVYADELELAGSLQRLT